MNRYVPLRWVLLGVLLILECLAIGCAESSEQRARRLEPMLTQAGFRVVPANTPTRLQRLADITPLRMSHVSRNGTSSYWFADPYVCHCIYVGGQQEYQQFEQQKAQAADQQRFEQFMASPANQVLYGQ
jgi:hypothetical protein